MSDFFNNFLNLLTDKTISFSRRTSFLILIVLFILLANDTFNFSFNYRINQKIEQLKSIYSLYPKGSIDSINVKMTLVNLENEIKERKTFISKIKKTLSEIIGGELTQSQKNQLSKLFSANILFIILLPIFLFTEKNKQSRKNIFLGLFIIALISNVIFFLIPTFDNIVINHIIQIVSEILFFIIITIFYSRKNK